MDNEDKKSWCDYGEQTEAAFAGNVVADGCVVFPNPAKHENKYTHDMFIIMPCDLKTIRTRFRTSDRYGIPSLSAITLNKKDVDRYNEKYPHLVIIFDVDYGDFKRLCYAPMREINRAIQLNKACLHTYKNRVNDTKGNAKDSWVLDSMWFKELK